MDIAGSTGTDVNSASTSNDIIYSSGLIWMLSIFSMKSMLFFTWCDDLPTKSLRILESSFAVAWVTDPMLEIIGLKWHPLFVHLG